MTTIDVTGNQMEFLPITRRDLTDLWPHKDLGWAYERQSNDHIESGRSLIYLQKKGDSIAIAFKIKYKSVKQVSNLGQSNPGWPLGWPWLIKVLQGDCKHQQSTELF